MIRFNLLATGLLLLATSSLAAPVRIAILDNLQLEKIASERYVQEYLRGVDLGVNEAKNEAIEFEVHDFFFGKKALDILDMAKAVEAWNPDVVIGPRSSDLFLLLKDHFKNTLVLSPLATAKAIAALPSNFWVVRRIYG